MCRVCCISHCPQCHALPARIPNTRNGSRNAAVLNATHQVHGACAQFGVSERQCTFGHRRHGVDILASTNLSLALSGFLHACALSFWKAKTDLYIIFFFIFNTLGIDLKVWCKTLSMECQSQVGLSISIVFLWRGECAGNNCISIEKFCGASNRAFCPCPQSPTTIGTLFYGSCTR